LSLEEEKGAAEQVAAASKPLWRFFPSAPAAFITGCLTPLVVENLIYLQGQGVSDLVLIPIGIVGLQLPMTVATCDLAYPWRKGLRFSLFRYALPKGTDFKELYFPAWRRMVVWFIGAVISGLVQSGHLSLRP
jgi:hypothetical protein